MSKRILLGRGMAALAVGLVLMALACQPGTMPLGSGQAVTVDQIVADPQRFVGKRVEADGEVGRVVAERVIALRSATMAGEVLAIVSEQALKDVDAIVPGEALHVAGTVQVMSHEELLRVEQQLGIQLDEEKLLKLANQAPFIVAQKVSK